MFSLPQPPPQCSWLQWCARAQPRTQGCSHGVLSILDACWPQGSLLCLLLLSCPKQQELAQCSGSLRIRSRGNQEAINLFRRWQHNCEIQPCSEAKRQSPSVAQLTAVHLDGCSWLCRLRLWGGRLAQPCRALAAARELWHLCTREQHTPWGRAHSTCPHTALHLRERVGTSTECAGQNCGAQAPCAG